MAEHGLPNEGGNIGAQNTGPGTMHVGTAIGQQNNTPAPSPSPGHAPARRGPGADVGVITVLPVEMLAVTRVLQRAQGYRTHQLYGGAQAHEAGVPVTSGMLRTVAIQALRPGPRSAVSAYHLLRDHYAPPIVLLVGIAGAIRSGVDVGDVVISDEVIYYDARREAADGVHRRGQSHQTAPALGHRLNAFLHTHGSTVRVDVDSSFTVHRGPIGSGDAVVTDATSDTRRWLREFHEKTLAVETEAAGLAQAFHEDVRHDTALCGWLTVRGISDQADAVKGYAHHDLAAERAALVLERLLPFLLLTGTTRSGE